jgi:hypothetical protein
LFPFFLPEVSPSAFARVSVLHPFGDFFFPFFIKHSFITPFSSLEEGRRETNSPSGTKKTKREEKVPEGD